MRIVYLVNQYPSVSHTFIRREILALEQDGFEITRIALRGWDAHLADDSDIAERTRTHYVLQKGLHALVLSVLRAFVSSPMRTLRAIWLAVQMSRGAERPLYAHLAYFAEAAYVSHMMAGLEISHLHAHFGTNSAEVAMLVHEMTGRSWSVTVHGPEEFDKRHQIGLARKVRSCSFVVAISSFGRSQLYRLLHFRDWSKVHVVHCGLDRSFYEGNIPPAAAASSRLICVGRLSEQKGHPILIEAARRLKEKGRSFELVFAGDGLRRQEIEGLIDAAGLRSHIRITGWISSGQVRDEILASRAMVLPSFAEGLPVVIMEAMALKRPVISTYVAGIPELVEPGRHGWLVAAGDIEGLSQAMESCLDLPAEDVRRMGELARERALTRHAIDDQAAKLASLFRKTSTTAGAR